MSSQARLSKVIHTLKKSRVFKILGSSFLSVLVLSNIAVSAFAAAAAALTAAGVSALLALLVSLGVLANAGETYYVTDNYPYVSDVLGGSGSAFSSESIFDYLPENLYYEDTNGNVFIGNSTDNPVTSVSQLCFRGDAIIKDYSLPVNTVGSVTGVMNKSNSMAYPTDLDKIWESFPGMNNWLVPFIMDSSDVVFVGDRAINLPPSSPYLLIASVTDSSFSEANTINLQRVDNMHYYLGFALKLNSSNSYIYTKYYFNDDGGFNGQALTALPRSATPTQYIGPSGTITKFLSDELSYFEVCYPRGGVIVCDGVPVTQLQLEKDKMEDVIVSVGGSPQPPKKPDDPDDPDPYIQLAPTLWQVFDTISDFIDKTSSLNTNNSTTVGNYSQNNYQYNINVQTNPTVSDYFIKSEISGSLDINLGGSINIDVNINDNPSLPSVSEGDGSNFFNADVVDVFSGLIYKNPLISVITSLFQAIDPALVAVFSVTVSLCFLLALWKLIRG